MLPQLKQIGKNEFPPLLNEISDPPEKLYIRGELPPKDFVYLSVIGSRSNTSYGKSVCENIIKNLSGYNIAIVSGLALGIDSIAHRSAIEAGLPTVAFPGSGLNEKVIYPSTNKMLADDITKNNGVLLSEFEPNFRATPYCFAQRNRLIAGVSTAVLVIEAAERSGALMTARLASEYNRDIFAIPGPINSQVSKGTNKLIKTGGALITNFEDVLKELGIKKIEKHRKTLKLNEKEQAVYKLLIEPMEKDDLIEKLPFSINEINILLSAMEMKGIIEERMGKVCLKT